MPSTTPLALFVGMPGTALSADEVAFFREANPYGLFLFARNLETPDQVRRLAAQFREAVGRDDAPVFIDQEGGRVQRFPQPGPWQWFRPLADFGLLAQKDLELAKRAVRLSSQAMGTMLSENSIDSGTTPVVDLVRPYTHGMLGDRGLGDDPATVIALGREIVDGLLETGQIPVVKHVPGYGRATVDPHLECPVIDASIEDMRGSDFKPFVALKDSPWAMVAHVLFTGIDPENVATVSTKVLDVIRDEIGYDGILFSDCVTMESLSGSWDARVKAVLDAGYDIALHSQGTLEQSEAAAKAARPLTDKALERIARGEAMRGSLRVDVQARHDEVEEIFRNSGIA